MKNSDKKRVTIKDVAKASGVSIATVSYVLNNTPGQSISEETKKKVLQFANLLGYECNSLAKYLATGKTNAIAAVIGDMPPFAAEYYVTLLTELSRLLIRNGVELKLIDYSDALSRPGIMCDAFITVALSEKHFRDFADTKYVPVIAIDTVLDDYLFYRINDSYGNISRQARQSGDNNVRLLSFGLPASNTADASEYFDGVDIITDAAQLAGLDRSAVYYTVSKTLAQLCVDIDVRFITGSCALKASAAAEAVIKAVSRVRSSDDEHDIRV